MANSHLPSVRYLKQLLMYDPETGVLSWRARHAHHFQPQKRDAAWVASIWNGNYAGKPAGGKCCHGYLSVSFLGVRIYAHRVAWAIHYGEWPSGQIDHINGDRSDNSIKNLRVVSVSVNNRNSAIQRNNTSGCVGVSYNKDAKKWWAYIYALDGKRVFLGAFKNKKDAIATRKGAEEKYAYHTNHGRASS